MRFQPAILIALFAAVVLSACGGGKNVRSDDPYAPDRVASVIQNLKYHNVIIHPYTVDKSVDEPGTAAADCYQATLDYLARTNIFSSVKQTTGAAPDLDTLVVDADVQSLRIVGGAARFWAGAFAGSSQMTLEVVARDSGGATVGQRAVSNSNNAVGASWSFGASDRGLPGDMGPLVADAIIRLAQRPVAATEAKSASDQPKQTSESPRK